MWVNVMNKSGVANEMRVVIVEEVEARILEEGVIEGEEGKVRKRLILESQMFKREREGRKGETLRERKECQ